MEYYIRPTRRQRAALGAKELPPAAVRAIVTSIATVAGADIQLPTNEFLHGYSFRGAEPQPSTPRFREPSRPITVFPGSNELVSRRLRSRFQE